METLTYLEKAVLEMLLSGEADKLRILKKQIPALRVKERKMTGVGFFTRFSIPEGIPKLSDNATFPVDDVAADIDGLKHGAGFVLFVENGQIDTLEGYTYDEPWPKEVSSFRLRPIQTNKTVSHSNQ